MAGNCTMYTVCNDNKYEEYMRMHSLVCLLIDHEALKKYYIIICSNYYKVTCIGVLLYMLCINNHMTLYKNNYNIYTIKLVNVIVD